MSARALLSQGRLSSPVAVQYLLAGILLVSSIVWDVQNLPSSPILGRDFGAFYAAGVTWHHGHNPYNWAQLGEVEAHLPSAGDPGHSMGFNSYANPPLFAWAMIPFSAISPYDAYLVWLAITIVALLSGLVILARSYGMHGRGWLLLLFAISPISVIALFLGQQTPILLLGLATAHVFLRHGRPELAGVALSIGWIKPHLVFPLFLLMLVLLKRREASRILVGFGATTIFMGVLSLIVTGEAMFGAWLRELVVYGQTMATSQPDLSSLAGLYMSALGRPWSGYIAALLVVAWILFAAALVWRARRQEIVPSDDAWFRIVGTSTATWLLVIPYAHPADLVLLAMALPAVVGRRLENFRDARVRLAIGMLLIAPEADLLGFRPNLALSYSVLVSMTFLAAMRPWQLLRSRPSRTLPA